MTRGGQREVAGWAVACALSVVIVGQVCSTARAELLFRDGDSVVVALAARSLGAGETGDWAFSSVLFLPEIGLLLLLRGLLPGVGMLILLALNAVANLLALYGAFRVAAGRRAPGHAPVAWSLLALGGYGVFAIGEASPSRDALEPASLLLSTTYYSASVIGAVLLVGVLRR